jgi:hypothetical protein
MVLESEESAEREGKANAEREKWRWDKAERIRTRHRDISREERQAAMHCNLVMADQARLGKSFALRRPFLLLHLESARISEKMQANVLNSPDRSLYD